MNRHRFTSHHRNRQTIVRQSLPWEQKRSWGCGTYALVIALVIVGVVAIL